MQIEWTDDAKQDLKDAVNFFEKQQEGLGQYFLNSIDKDVTSRLSLGAIHTKKYKFHRFFTTKFTFAIYYTVVNNVLWVAAILDCRRNPNWIKNKLKRRDTI